MSNGEVSARLNAVLSSVAQQVGNKFRYTHVDRDERSLALAQAVELLSLARVCHRVRATPATALPLAAGVDEKRFKLILLDVGLLSACLGSSVVGLDATADLMLANRGALAEQVIGQLLRLGFRAHEEPALYYWHREARGSEAELDYVTQQGAHVVPVEVKAGTTGSHKSLHIFMAERGFPLAVRFNADPPTVTEVVASTRLGTTAKYTLLSLPLYLAEELPRLVIPRPVEAGSREPDRRPTSSEARASASVVAGVATSAGAREAEIDEVRMAVQRSDRIRDPLRRNIVDLAKQPILGASAEACFD